MNKRRVQPHPEHLTPADRPAWKTRRESLVADIDAQTIKALWKLCPTCQALPGHPCLTLDGTPHAVRAGQ